MSRFKDIRKIREYFCCGTTIDDKIPTDTIYLDLTKAFDTVSYSILLTKLEYYGIKNKELSWFQSYLSDRTQAVDINGEISTTKNVVMGVPQGSIIGAILFLNFYK